MCMFPTATKLDRLSPLPPNDGPIPSRRGSRASDLLFDAKADPLRGLTRRPKQAGDSSILAPIPPNKPLGDRPLSEWNLHPIVNFGVIRHDKRGSGDFGALRTNQKQSYPHEGVDIAVLPGTLVRAPADGEVTVFDPYRKRPELRGKVNAIMIKTADGRLLTIMYVKPADGVTNGMWVRAGDEIGKSQSLQEVHPPKAEGAMTDHVHFQMERRAVPPGEAKALVDPTELVRQWLYPPKF